MANYFITMFIMSLIENFRMVQRRKYFTIVDIEFSAWRHGFDWLTEKLPLSPAPDPVKALFYSNWFHTWARIIVANENIGDILG